MYDDDKTLKETEIRDADGRIVGWAYSFQNHSGIMRHGDTPDPTAGEHTCCWHNEQMQCTASTNHIDEFCCHCGVHRCFIVPTEHGKYL